MLSGNINYLASSVNLLENPKYLHLRIPSCFHDCFLSKSLRPVVNPSSEGQESRISSGPIFGGQATNIDELQIYIVTADADYNAKIAIYGPQDTPPTEASLRMYTVSFSLGSTGWVGAALDGSSAYTSLPAGNYWFSVLEDEDDETLNLATTRRDTDANNHPAPSYDNFSWYTTTMFTWPDFPATLPSLTHSSSRKYGVFRIACTVPPDISNLPNNYGFGTVAEGSTTETGLTYFTITNNSAFAVNITISGTDMTGGTA